jgi:hypothetical protein
VLPRVNLAEAGASNSPNLRCAGLVRSCGHRENRAGYPHIMVGYSGFTGNFLQAKSTWEYILSWGTLNLFCNS